LVLRDVRDGLVGVEAARALYGVELSTDRRSVDVTATEQRRRSM
jgi:hypothetical protein